MVDADANGIELREEPDLSLIEMWGEIDVALRAEAGAALANALARQLPLVVDTSRVTFMDSTGIAFLVQFAAAGAEQGLEVRLRRTPPVVSDVLDMLGVRGILVHEHDGGDAI